MSSPELHVVVPGPLQQRTGGYLYDARMVEGLRRLGWLVDVVNLEGSFPTGDELARAALNGALESLSDGTRILIDGLAMGGIPEPIHQHGSRLRILSLVHHPLGDETGISREERRRFVSSERDALKPCTGVIVTSEYTAQRLRVYYGVSPDRIRAVPPGTERARPARGPGAGEPPRLLCVGTVTPRKGHDVLVGALARVRDLNWTCVCAGSLDRDRRFAGSVLEQVRAAGLEKRIAFIGEHDAETLDEVYHTSSLFVLASHYEGYGMALAEALARGLPVVSTTGGAIPFTVPAHASVLVPPGDEGAFAGALRGLLEGDSSEGRSGPTAADRRETLAEAARRYAEGLPDWGQASGAFATAVLELTPREAGALPPTTGSDEAGG